MIIIIYIKNDPKIKIFVIFCGQSYYASFCELFAFFQCYARIIQIATKENDAI